MSRIYLSRAALDRVAAARATADRHVAHAATGWCLVCGVTTPCSSLREADEVLSRYGHPPPAGAGPVRRRSDDPDPARTRAVRGSGFPGPVS